MPEYCLGKYKTQEMFEKTVDIYPSSLKHVSNWFVTSAMLVIVDIAGLDKLFTWRNRYKQHKTC